MHNKSAKFLTAILLLTVSTAAFAHPGHDVSGYTAGLMHPFSGLDHLLAMAAVGLRKEEDAIYCCCPSHSWQCLGPVQD